MRKRIIRYLVLRPGRRAERELLPVADGRPAPVDLGFVLLAVFGFHLVLDVGQLQRGRPAVKPARSLCHLVRLCCLTSRLQGHQHRTCSAMKDEREQLNVVSL